MTDITQLQAGAPVMPGLNQPAPDFRANTTHGEKVIVPPPSTVDAAEKRMDEGFECTDWYFCKNAV